MSLMELTKKKKKLWQDYHSCRRSDLRRKSEGSVASSKRKTKKPEIETVNNNFRQQWQNEWANEWVSEWVSQHNYFQLFNQIVMERQHSLWVLAYRRNKYFFRFPIIHIRFCVDLWTLRMTEDESSFNLCGQRFSTRFGLCKTFKFEWTSPELPSAKTELDIPYGAKMNLCNVTFPVDNKHLKLRTSLGSVTHVKCPHLTLLHSI